MSGALLYQVYIMSKNEFLYAGRLRMWMKDKNAFFFKVIVADDIFRVQIKGKLK